LFIVRRACGETINKPRELISFFSRADLRVIHHGIRREHLRFYHAGWPTSGDRVHRIIRGFSSRDRCRRAFPDLQHRQLSRENFATLQSIHAIDLSSRRIRKREDSLYTGFSVVYFEGRGSDSAKS